MFKIALDAGHGIKTAGRRCLKKYDKNQTREWQLNSRICERIEALLKAYSGYELIRVDDITGERDVTLKERVKKANNFKADIYISVHHNGGINGGSGGGIIGFAYKNVGSPTTDYRNTIYDELIKHTGLKGNRAKPLDEATFYVLKATTMPAVLFECGFMDSSTDIPIIISEDFSEKAAKGFVSALAKIGGLVIKSDNEVAKEPVKKTNKEKIDVKYRSRTAFRWLPWVSNFNNKDEDGYAGIKGSAIKAVYCKLSKGSIKYRSHISNRWLPWVVDTEDYAGFYSKNMDGIQFKLQGLEGYSVRYRAHILKGEWLPWVKNDEDYAGIFGKSIDMIQMEIVSE